jgi:hypothetical protein
MVRLAPVTVPEIEAFPDTVNLSDGTSTPIPKLPEGVPSVYILVVILPLLASTLKRRRSGSVTDIISKACEELIPKKPPPTTESAADGEVEPIERIFPT